MTLPKKTPVHLRTFHHELAIPEYPPRRRCQWAKKLACLQRPLYIARFEFLRRGRSVCVERPLCLKHALDFANGYLAPGRFPPPAREGQNAV